jgi:hypothetical protein
MPSPDTNDRKTEQVLSWFILLCLLAIGGGVFLKQFSFNPAVLMARQLAAAPAAPSQSPIDSAWLPPELQAFGAPERFTPENLYDKIDGKAELYVSTGVARMDCQRFALKDAPNDWFEWFAYGMNGVPQAFSVFSTQHRAEGETLDLTPYAYRTRNAIYFVAGTNYIEAVGSSTSEPLRTAMLSMAKRFVAATSVGGVEQMPEMKILPTDCRVAGSVELQASDAFGFDRFKNVFTAQYNLDGTELMAFVTACATPEAATALRDAYRAFLVENGGKEAGPAIGEFGRPVELMGSLELVFSRGRYVAGIHAAPTSSAAEKIGNDLLQRLTAANK